MFSFLGNSNVGTLKASSLGKSFCSSSSSLKNLFHVNDDFDHSLFQKSLTTKYIGRQMIYRTTVTSTMDIAVSESDLGATTGTIVLAEEQTEGRGRAARPWISPPKTNLYFTIILKPKNFVDLPKINFAAAVAVAETARKHGVQNAGVKWPNDVHVDGKKLAGILTDTSIMGSNIVACVGIGINVNEKMSSVESEEVRSVATSISEACSHDVPRESVLASLCNEFEELLQQSFEDVMKLYSKLDLLIGKDIWVMPKKRENPERRAAKAIEFSKDGQLVVRLEDTQELMSLLGEEVSIRSR